MTFLIQACFLLPLALMDGSTSFKSFAFISYLPLLSSSKWIWHLKSTFIVHWHLSHSHRLPCRPATTHPIQNAAWYLFIISFTHPWNSYWEWFGVQYDSQGHFDMQPGHPGIKPPTFWLVDDPLSVVWSITCQKMVKNGDHLFPKDDILKVLFRPQLKYIMFTVRGVKKSKQYSNLKSMCLLFSILFYINYGKIKGITLIVLNLFGSFALKLSDNALGVQC